MHRRARIMLAFLLASATSAWAQFPPQPPAPPMPGSEQDRAACQPDVVRFCHAELATNQDDVFAILGCLQRNRAQISVACRQVLERNGK
jgi:hypothetical protein